MATLRGVKAKFEAHPRYDVPRHIYDIDSRPSRRSARTIADGFLKKIAKDLKIKANLSQLKFDKVKKTIFGITDLMATVLRRLSDFRRMDQSRYR